MEAATLQSHPYRNWRPLIPRSLARKNGVAVLAVDEDGLPAKVLFLPTGILVNAPIYWRRSDRGAEYVRLSGLTVTRSGEIDIIEIEIPAWFQSDDDHARAQNPNSKTMTGRECNAIGWALSFAFRPKGGNWAALDGVDLKLARRFFERGAELGFWPAKNNLAVMLRDGLGGEKSISAALSIFIDLASEQHPTPLRHLAAMVEKGVGCPKDTGLAAKLRALATTHAGKLSPRGRLA